MYCLLLFSDGGKVELWDIKEGTNVFSTIGHDDAITCVQVNLIFFFYRL